MPRIHHDENFEVAVPDLRPRMSATPDGPDLIRTWNVVVRGVSAVQHGLAMSAEDTGISAPYVPVLLVLLDAEDHRLPMSRIAKDLAMTSGGFTKLADRMARDGLIDRRGSSGDRRVVFAALTERGVSVARDASELYSGFLRERVLAAVSADDLLSVADLSERLRAANDPSELDGAFQLAPRSPDAPDRRREDD